MAREKHVNKTTEEAKAEIIENSVLGSGVPINPVGNATDMKKRFVNPIVNGDGNASVILELDRVVGETEAALDELDGKVNAADIEKGTAPGAVQQKTKLSDKEETEAKISNIYDGSRDYNKAKKEGAVALGGSTIADGMHSFSQGLGTYAGNLGTHSEGMMTRADGSCSHSEGQYTNAHADLSHTEGIGTITGNLAEDKVRSTGMGGHAEGLGTWVQGMCGHTQGAFTTAKGEYAFAGGLGANELSDNPEIVFGQFDDTHYVQNSTPGHGLWEGGGKTTLTSGRFISGTQSFAEFIGRVKVGDTVKVIHSSGVEQVLQVSSVAADGLAVNGSVAWLANDTYLRVELKVRDDDVYAGTAQGKASTTLGAHNVAMHDFQTVAGQYNKNKDNTLFEVGNGTSNSDRRNAFEVYKNGLASVGQQFQQMPDGVENGFDFTGKNPNATTLDATLTGNIPYGATGEFASAFGGKSSAQGKRSHAEGTTTIAKGKYSHAEGDNAVALGDQSHAEGYATTAAGWSSHAEGVSTATTEEGAHAEGVNTIAIGYAAHAEGGDTVAEGVYSHAEGNHAEARHNNSHAGGFYTKTGTVDQTVLGHFNIGKTDTLFEVGNGAGTDNRSNAIEVLKDGRTKVQGKPKEDDDVVRLEELKAAISGSGKYVLLTEEHATNPYKVPDNIRYVKFICDKTSSIDTYLGASISLGSVRYLLFRGTSYYSSPLTTSFSKDGYLSLISVGPTRYFALVELVESIENLDDLL